MKSIKLLMENFNKFLSEEQEESAPMPINMKMGKQGRSPGGKLYWLWTVFMGNEDGSSADPQYYIEVGIPGKGKTWHKITGEMFHSFSQKDWKEKTKWVDDDTLMGPEHELDLDLSKIPLA